MSCSDSLRYRLRLTGWLDIGRSAGETHSAKDDLLIRLHAGRMLTPRDELYGLLDLLTPERRLLHAWGDISRRAESPDEALASLLRGSVGECVLIVRSSAPMIYNLRPNPKAMRAAAESAGLEVTTITELSDARGAWAWLYQINEGAAAAPPPSAPPGP